MATFSYAQAAKGHTAASTPSTTPNPTSNEATNTQPSSSSIHPAKPDVNEAAYRAETALDTNQMPVQKPTLESISGSMLSMQLTGSSPPSVTDSGRGDGSTGREHSAQRSEQCTRSPSVASRAVDDGDAKKTKRTKKAKPSNRDAQDADEAKDKNEDLELDSYKAEKTELSEAPIPTVNVWQQRREAQAAKAKQVVADPPKAVAQSDSQGHSMTQDAKKKGKGLDEVDVSAADQNGTHVNGSKTEGRANDAGRPGQDSGPRRNGPRGARLSDTDDRPVSDALPPVGDAKSWPTPETATKEDRRKTEKNERPEKDGNEEVAQPKPRQKQKWESIPIVPTVNFQTPLPVSRRGGRGGGRGGRDASSRGGHSAGHGNGSEKNGAAGFSLKKANGDVRERPRDGSVTVPSRANSQPPNSNKRASLDASSSREQRKPSATGLTERGSDATPSFQDQSQANRSEGRAERGGRGGLRGRGGHQPAAQHGSFSAPWTANGTVYGINGAGRQQQIPFSPPPRSNVATFSAGPSRGGGRGGAPRTQTRPPQPVMQPGMQIGLLPGMNMPSGRPASMQTGMVYDGYIAQAAPPPYQGIYYDPLIVAGARSQLDYYFSFENLLKDVFLRSNMDSQGFVPVPVVMGFQRMTQITRDIEVIRAACAESSVVELAVGSDGYERIRPRLNWVQWVLPIEERVPRAQNDGPSYLYQHTNPAPYAAYPAMVSPTYYPTNGDARGSEPENTSERAANGHSHSSTYGGQLSAAVPEFSPRSAGENSGTFTAFSPFANGQPHGLYHAPSQEGHSGQPEAAGHSASQPLSNGPLNGDTLTAQDIEDMARPVNGLGLEYPADAVSTSPNQVPEA